MSTILRSSRRCFAPLASLFVALTGAFAQTAPTPLAPFVTTATRTPAEPQTLGSAVEFVSADDLARRQITSLSDALGGVPGAPAFASGANGAVTSLFLRGSNSNQTLFLVDGLRLNDANTDYAVFLGGACVGACDSLEIAHGPQSTLYGGEAVGGVISLRAERGAGVPSGRISVEAGSFGTVQGAVVAQGEKDTNAWSASVQGGHTDNERVNNAFDSANLALRFDHKVSTSTTVGATARWFHGAYGSPGTRFTNDPDNDEREDNVLVTGFADLKPGPNWTAHVVLGGQDRRYVSENPRAGAATQITEVTNRRGVFDGQASFTGFERQRITAGLTTELNHTRNTGFGNINERQALFAVFAQDEWSPRDDLYVTGGIRNDDFDTFGRATTGRATIAWLPIPKTLKLRSSYGTAFRSPSFLDLYGQSAFYTGNPNLNPETARGWDAGVDYYFANQSGQLGVTWFETKFTDLIASNATFTSVENIQRARTRGLEISGRWKFGAAVEARFSYTNLEAENLTTNTRLLRRPRNSGSADLLWTATSSLTVGAGIAVTSGRRDIDARTFAQIDGEDYTVVRLHASWQATPKLTVKARFENLLNEKYEEVNGYPALGFGVFGGVEWRF